MGPPHLLMITMLLALARPRMASQFCSYLEYWNPDNRCCSPCRERFGLPPCADEEFIENCGISDTGDYLKYPFKECPPGQCNPDGAERCRPCGDDGAIAPTPITSYGGTQKRCKEKTTPPKKPCQYGSSSAKANALSTQEPSSQVVPSQPWPSDPQHRPEVTRLPLHFRDFPLPMALVLLVMLPLILLLAVLRPCSQHKGNVTPLSLVGCKQDTPVHLHLPSPEPLKAPELGDTQVSLPLLEGTELSSLAKQPLSRLLDELEVLEELILLLDPEPGPGGRTASGTTRHLAARYGLPAAWSNFAYSLRPSRSPLRALLEMVVAREPTACLGQFALHLAQVGRADALQVLSKLT